MQRKGLKLNRWLSPDPVVGMICSCIIAGGLLPRVHAAAWETFQTDPPQSLSWVYYDARYPVPPHDYPGAWNAPNSWPAAGATVTIRHPISLNNNPYLYVPPDNTPVYPFPGGHTTSDGSPQGVLTVNVLNIQPGGWLMSSLEELAFDGVSSWSGGAISAGASAPPGIVHNQGRLSVTGPFNLIRGGAGMLNTEHMEISSAFYIDFHCVLTNRSGGGADRSVAEVVLSGPGASIEQGYNSGGAAAHLANYGVLRKTGSATSTIKIQVVNDTATGLNQAGTVAVDEGVLLLEPGSPSLIRGLKAEVAPGALLVLRGSHFFEPGDVTVSGGGVLRLETLPGTEFGSASDAPGTLAAPEGKLECAGAFLRNLVNKGSIHVTERSTWLGVVNHGQARLRQSIVNWLVDNGSPSEHAATMDLEGDVNLAPPNTGGLLRNYAQLRKTGNGVSEVQIESIHSGAGGGLRIEAQSGTLRFPAAVTFVNGGAIRVGNGATVQFLHRNYVDGGTLSLTGSGKCYLEANSWLRPSAPPATFTLDSAPGVLELRGGDLHPPFDNAGELTVTAPTGVGYAFLGYCPINNSGTIHFTATSAGANANSMTLGPLTAIVCMPSSTLAFDIAGRPDAREKWARIAQAGQTSVSYGGTLRINFGEFSPVSGDRWTIVDNRSGSPENPGNFARVQFANVPAGFLPIFEKLPDGLRIGLDAAPLPQTFAQWASAQHFASPAAAAFEADPDGDGVNNGTEYALGTDPQSKLSRPRLEAVIRSSGGDQFLGARFTRPGGAARGADVQLIAERSADLIHWSPDGVIAEVEPIDTGSNETVILRPTTDIPHQPHQFLRLRVSAGTP